MLGDILADFLFAHGSGQSYTPVHGICISVQDNKFCVAFLNQLCVAVVGLEKLGTPLRTVLQLCLGLDISEGCSSTRQASIIDVRIAHVAHSTHKDQNAYEHAQHQYLGSLPLAPIWTPAGAAAAADPLEEGADLGPGEFQPPCH